MARKYAKAEVINYEEVSAGDALKEMSGRGPDCLDAVGLEAHGVGMKTFMTRQKKLKLETDLLTFYEKWWSLVVKAALSIMGVYGGVDKIHLCSHE